LTGKEVLNGLYSVSQITVNKSDSYWRMIALKCQDNKGFKKLLDDASWANKNTLGIRKECQPKINSSTYCEYARAASLDVLVVNRLFPELVTYFEGFDCLEKTGENDNYVIYLLKDKKPYIDFQGTAADYTYIKAPGSIRVSFSVKDAGKTSVDISESYVRHWKAWLDEKEIPIERNAYGYMTLDLDVSSGGHALVLQYLPERFGNLFYYVSAVSWILVLAGLIAYRNNGGGKKTRAGSKKHKS